MTLLINPIYPVEYSIRLTTNEVIDISEYDYELVPVLKDERVVLNGHDFLRFCPTISREVLEELKRGYDTRFKGIARKPPMSALLNIESKFCRIREECTMYNLKSCTANRILGGKIDFPICFEYEPPKFISEEIQSIVSALGTSIVHAWKQNRIVVLVNN